MKSKNYILLNIGNTHFEWAVVANGACRETGGGDTKDFSCKCLPQNLQVAAASVVPRCTEELKSSNREVFWVTAENCDFLNFEQVDSSTIGMDRIANAAKLYQLCQTQPSMSIDFGTAITFEVVEPNGRFAGGAILPGRLLLRKTLSGNTAQLPEISLTTEIPRFPGRNTVEAIKIGTDAGCVGAVREIIHLATRQYGKELQIFAVGGDRNFFLNRLPLKDGGEHFTLEGIDYAAQRKF